MNICICIYVDLYVYVCYEMFVGSAERMCEFDAGEIVYNVSRQMLFKLYKDISISV